MPGDKVRIVGTIGPVMDVVSSNRYETLVKWNWNGYNKRKLVPTVALVKDNG